MRRRGARGDALDLVAHLRGLDAAGALAEAERFLGRENTGPEPKAGDADGGQMALFGTPAGGSRSQAAGAAVRQAPESWGIGAGGDAARTAGRCRVSPPRRRTGEP